MFGCLCCWWFFFFKQKTAYEMRISDWSSDVCSSDLSRAVTGFPFPNWAVWSSHVARVTVEDCIDKVSNRFDLVLLAGQRARQISGGAELTVDRDRAKNPVVALREIAEETIDRKSVV